MRSIIVATLFVMVIAAPALARPEYAMKEMKECLYCHVRPGEDRNFRGLYYAAHKHSFDGFDEEIEAMRAGVKKDSKGSEARPTVKGYPDVAAGVGPALDFSMKDIDGNYVNLARFQGNVILIVNVASFCGNTPQYASLQKLYLRYKDRGFTILAFPCNDFGAQEPGSEKQIKEFCRSTYGVTFPLFSKIAVQGEERAPLYRFLTDRRKNPAFGGEIEWNFAKFLINRKGEVVARFRPEIDPLLPRLTSEIERQLLFARPENMKRL